MEIRHPGTPIGSAGPRTGSDAGPHTNERRREAHSPARAVLYGLIGLVGGLFGGLLGIGGGSAIAPLLLLTTTLRPAQVAGTTLATVLVIATAGSGTYASLGHLSLRLAWPIALGSVAGAVLGARTSSRLSMRLMLTLFVVILPYFIVKEFWPSFAAPLVGTNLGWLVFLGLGTGFFSGLLGIGGASLVVPSLVAFFLIDHHAAQGIALIVALADSSAGVATHARARTIDYRSLPYLAVPAFLSAVVGSFISHALPVAVLRNIFGGFVAVVWVIMLMRLVHYSVGRRGMSRSVGNTSVNGSGPRPVSGDEGPRQAGPKK